MLNRFKRIFGELAVAAIVAGCVAAPAGAADVWRYGVVEAKGDAGILFMPAKFGPKYDIDIQMVGFASSTTPVRALISGALDVFTTSPAVALPAMSRGAKLKFIGCNWPGATYDLYGAADVKSIADLKGKSVGVSGPGSAPDLFAREILSQNGLSEKDVTFANSGGGSDRFKALAAGIVNATATSTEFEPEAEKQGFKVLASAYRDMPNFARNCLVTTEEVVKNRHDGLVRFLAANMDALSFVLSHPDETMALARETAKLPPLDTSAAFIYEEAKRQKSLDPTLAVPVDKIQWIEDMLARHHAIPASQPIADFIDDGARQDAQKLLKP
jgi:NitT/TauT family transport system substrate-binding protein